MTRLSKVEVLGIAGFTICFLLMLFIPNLEIFFVGLLIGLPVSLVSLALAWLLFLNPPDLLRCLHGYAYLGPDCPRCVLVEGYTSKALFVYPALLIGLIVLLVNI